MEDYNSKETLVNKFESPKVGAGIEETKSSYSHNTSMMFPEIGKKRGHGFPITSPYNDDMF